ncbi:MFS transporter [Bifidobacterium amazonense]|uniref:MFS transporter n=1 Tax=Bifidobacterium amazonense TaxID=2809027 RepID=A0ABS9VWA7_9BIFI|nr:MFS transporter [Bifidobacterium amazonense]MCH9276402.1 MFS transporter [Bifidobacterium amazonense]
MTHQKNVNSLAVILPMLSISLFLTSYSVVNGVIPQLGRALSVDNTSAELLSTTPSLTALVTLIFSPALARLFGLKKVIASGLFLVGVTAFVPMFATNFAVVMAARVLFGMGLGLYNSLAITLIQMLYSGDRRATLLGIRGATENLGQAVMTALVSVFVLAAGWKGAFVVYLFAFPVLIWFWIQVPDVHLDKSGATDFEDETAEANRYPERTSPVLGAFCACAALYMVFFNAINVRFAEIAQHILNDRNFDSSVIISVGVLFAVVAGFVYGLLEKRFGDMTFLIGMGIYFLGSLLVSVCGNSFPVLVAGFFLFNIPGPILGPFLCNRIPTYAKKSAQAFWSTMIILSFHVGVFVSPLAMKAVSAITGSSDPAAPFPWFTAGFAIIIAVFVVWRATHRTNKPFPALSR